MRLFYLSVLLYLSVCTSLSAQFSVSADFGVAYSLFNSRPDIATETQSLVQSDQFDDEGLRAIGNEAYGIAIAYEPGESRLSYQLHVQYLRRGYQHVLSDRRSGYANSDETMTSQVGFIDFQPAIRYALTERLEINGGPYASLAVDEVRSVMSTTVPREDRILHGEDFGAHLGFRFAFNRFYVYGSYQRSMRDFNLAHFTAVHSEAATPEESNPVSSLLVGVGYVLIR